MSETNIIPINKIEVPTLGDVTYASDLSAALNSINDNFTTLANRDFVKGEHGTSVQIVEDKFFIDGEITILGTKLKKCIEARSTDLERADVTYEGGTLTLWDNFTQETAGSLYMIYNAENNEALPGAISSLYYIFLDGRFMTDKIGTIDPDKFNNLKDLSCVLVYDKDVKVELDGHLVDGGFKALDNAFPTIYYERGVGLCWKINGNGTGLPIQGVPGVDGRDATLNIVKCSQITNENAIIRGEVTGVYSIYDGYIAVTEVEDLNAFDGAAALILAPSATGNGNYFYFGYTHISEVENEDKTITRTMYAECNQDTAITYGIENENFVTAMKNINLAGNNGISDIKGLFLPIDAERNGVQPVHLLSATSITNESGQTENKNTDIIFTPVANINALNVLDAKPLTVDKYLYLRINKDYNSIFTDLNAPIKTTCENHKYILKYKLTNTVVGTNNNWFDVYNPATSSSAGSRFFGKVSYNGSGVLLSDANTRYYVVDTDNNTTTTKSGSHIDSMPAAFKTAINGAGVYRWELCTIKHDFDIDELAATGATGYDFYDGFNVIFTNTINPGATTDFWWFNGLEIAGPDYFNIEDPNNEGGSINQSSNYIIPGWNNTTIEPILSFIKFVPVYNDATFSYGGSSSLNMQYDVTIGGNTADASKNLTVNGNVNCDDLNVYKLTATGEIKNIYTKEAIVGDAGIKLALTADEDGNIAHAFEVGGDGRIKTKSSISASEITVTGDLKGDNVRVRQAITNELFINNGNSRRVYAGNIGNGADEYKFGIELQDVNSISMRSGEATLGVTALQPTVGSNISLIQHDKSNVIVSNQVPGSDNLCYYGVEAGTAENRRAEASAGSGVTGSAMPDQNYIHNPEFDYVKNFNMFRLAGQSKNVNQLTMNYKCSKVDISSFDSIFNYHENAIAKAPASISGTTGAGSLEKGYSIKCDPSYKSGKYICKFDLSRTSDTHKFNAVEPIHIEFDCNFISKIGVAGKCSNTAWPVLWDGARMYLHTYYQIGNNTPVEISAAKKEFTFDWVVSDIKRKNSNGHEWRGYDLSGNYLGSEYGNHWRYYDFVFRPQNINISQYSDAYNKIATAYNEGKTITIFVAPAFDLWVRGQEYASTQRSVVSGGVVYLPIPIKVGETESAVLREKASTLTKIDADKTDWKLRAIESTPAHIKYYINEYGSADTKSTTLCNDGVVIRSGNYVFGLGQSQAFVDHQATGYHYTTRATIKGGVETIPVWGTAPGDNTSIVYDENKPVLFYHEYTPLLYTDGGSPVQGAGGNDIRGYSRRTNVIPLEDIFYAIKHIRETKGEWSEFGL